MWRSNVSLEKLSPAYVYTDLNAKAIQVIEDTPVADISQTVAVENLIHFISFKDSLKKLNYLKGSLDINFKPLYVTKGTEKAANKNIFLSNIFAAELSSFFLTQSLQPVLVFNNEHTDLDLTYEIVISNINSFLDIVNLIKLPINHIEVEIRSNQNIKTKVTQDFLENITFSKNVSVILNITQQIYSINQDPLKVFCFDVKPVSYVISSIDNNLNYNPDIINWSLNGLYRRIESTSNLDTGTFYSNRNHINFVKRIL